MTKTEAIVVPECAIPFSGPMVRAILEGRKTQTRRMVKPVRGFERHNILKYGLPHAADTWAVWWHSEETDRVGCLQDCPYGAPGDRLWVRETWKCDQVWNQFSPIEIGPREADILFLADEQSPSRKGVYWGKTRPSIFMPRWASRITLEVTDVRAERLQEISEADAISEGIQVDECGHVIREDDPINWGGAIWEFAKVWESINGKGSWAQNPWVWVVEFKRIAQESVVE